LEIGDVLRKIYDVICHRPMNFSFVDNYVCGSARIMSKSDIVWLGGKEVKAILALTETSAPTSWIGGSGIEYKHVPVKNHFAPTLAQMEECVDFIEKNVQKANKTLVHCAAGKGRTGTVIAAYVCKRDNIPAELAIEQLRAKRGGSVERNPSSGQENAVIAFRKSLYKQKQDSD
jgi:atypical dual specificity phosphatase